MGNELFQTRLPDRFAERLTEYAEDYEMNTSEAMRHLMRKGLSEEGYPIPATDGGADVILTRREHPWIEPLIQFGYDTSRLAIYVTALATLAYAIPTTAVNLFGVGISASTAALFLSFIVIMGLAGGISLVLSVGSLLVLEYLMHPSEAPFRRYFYTPGDTGSTEATA